MTSVVQNCPLETTTGKIRNDHDSLYYLWSLVDP